SLISELSVFAEFRRENPTDPILTGNSGRAVFEADDIALLEFLHPAGGSGPTILRPYREYHSPLAGDFITEILSLLDLGKATDVVRRYFADMLSKEVFSNQETKFVSNKLGKHYVQLYFEEAHNL